VSFDEWSHEQAFHTDAQHLCSANCPPTTKVFFQTAFFSFWECLLIIPIIREGIRNVVTHVLQVPVEDWSASKSACAAESCSMLSPRYLTWRARLAAVWLLTTCVYSFKINQYSLQAQISLLYSPTLKMTQKCSFPTSAATNTSLYRRTQDYSSKSSTVNYLNVSTPSAPPQKRLCIADRPTFTLLFP